MHHTGESSKTNNFGGPMAWGLHGYLRSDPNPFESMSQETQNDTRGHGPAVADAELGCLSQVEQIMKSLTKLIHGRKLYAENNPRLAEFGREFEAGLRAYFRREDTLVLGIDQYTFRWREQTVYENEKREESIAFLLHRDGVGEITLDERAIGEETNRLVEILTEEYHNLTSDEDVVTKFWNADFEHISYRVLDDYLSVEYGDPQSSRSDSPPDQGSLDHPELLPSLEDKGRVIIQRSDPLESIDGYLKKLILRTCQSSNNSEQEAYFQSMVGSFFTVSAEELSRFQEELRKELQRDSLATFVETTFVFTLLQENPTAVRDIAGVIERIVEHTVDDLDPYTLGRILNLVRDFRREHTLPENVESLCARIESKVTEDTVIQSLGERLKFWNKDSEELLTYFSIVGRAVVDPLLKVLHNVEGERLHREICDVLITVSGDDITSVIEMLDVDKPSVAFDAVYIANQIGMENMSPKIKELLLFPDIAVKEEMIKLVERVDDPSAVDLLLGALTDEEKQIRMQALEAAARKNDPRVLERLREIAFGKGLSDMPADEQEMIFGILGRIGNAGTVEDLKKFIDKKSIMNFGRTRDNKVLAIHALENLKRPAALGLLKKLASDSNELVKTRAQRAYESLSKVMKDDRARQTSGSDQQ
jgi:hypothetical protein